MGLDLNRLLEIRLFQAFDVDGSGRVLAGSDDTGSTQLIEIAGDDTTTQLTALPGTCTGRYVPGQRAVIVSHDVGGNERYQLSLLRLPRENAAAEADLEPLVRDPRYIHTLPSSCKVTARSATATGTYRDGFAAEVYARYGEVIDLYVFSRPTAGYPEGIQLANEPFTRLSPFIGGKGPWTVTVPIDKTLGQPARCMVAAQPTMDFQGAP
jgi:hypothetical protein